MLTFRTNERYGVVSLNQLRTAEDGSSEQLVPFFTHCDPDDPFAVEQMELNRRQLEFWVRNAPSDEADFETTAKTIAARMGMTLPRVRSIILAFRKLKSLPKLMKLAQEMGHLDLDRIITIDRATKGMATEHLSELDDYAVGLLSPVCPRQTLRQPAAIANRLKGFLIKVDPDAVQQRIDDERGVSVIAEANTARVSARLSHDEAFEYQQLIADVKQRCGLDNDADALMELVRGHSTAKVTLNLVPNEHGNLEVLGAGTLTPKQMVYWLSKVSGVRIFHEHIDEKADKRFFDPVSQTFITARDGYCVGLACTVNAINGQGDHTENFNGSNTTSENGGELCQHCHNQKTDGRLNMVAVNGRGVKMWITPDGRQHVTLPDGPLVGSNEKLLTIDEYLAARAKGKVPTPNSQNWGQTVGQKAEKAIENARKAA